MENRFIAVAGAALVIVGGIAGCSSSPPTAPRQPGTLPPGTAQLTINGKDAGPTHAVNCSQVDWTWIIDAGDKAAGATAVVEGGGALTAKSVEIRNLDGFSGTYWDGNGGKADASIVGDTWMITGTVDGFPTDNPKPATATFEVKANC